MGWSDKWTWTRNIAKVLTFVYEDYFNDGVQRDVDGVRAHAVLGAVWRAIVSVAELFWRYVLDLGQQRGWR